MRGTGRDEQGLALVMTIFFGMLCPVLGITLMYVTLNSQMTVTLTQDNETTFFKVLSGLKRSELAIAQEVLISPSDLSDPSADWSWLPEAYQTTGYILESQGQGQSQVKSVQMLDADVFIIQQELNAYQIISRAEFRGTERILFENINYFSSVIDLLFSAAVAADEDGGIQTQGSVTINGDTMLLPELPPIIEPATYDHDNTGTTLNFSTTLSDDNGDASQPTTYFYDEVDLGGNDAVDVQGHVRLFVNDVTMKGNSILGRCSGETDISATGDCSLMVYVLGSSGAFKILSGTPDMRGMIYAPEITVDASGSPTIYGSLVAFAVTLKGNTEVNYDPDLAEMLDDIGVTEIEFEPGFQILSWGEI
ncbi:MAG: hypothetical protein ACE5JP_09665 [Candidatus Bipolaricaulia bacterium]